MSELASMFQEMGADLNGPPAFPLSRTADAEDQAFDRKNFSAVSAVSAPQKYCAEFLPQDFPQVGARVQAGAREKISW